MFPESARDGAQGSKSIHSSARATFLVATVKISDVYYWLLFKSLCRLASQAVTQKFKIEDRSLTKHF